MILQWTWATETSHTSVAATVRLTLILLTWRIGWAPNNASKWQMRFNSAFKGLTELSGYSPWCSLSKSVQNLFRTQLVLPETTLMLSVIYMPPSTTAMLEPMVPGHEKSSKAIRKFDHITCLNTFRFSTCVYISLSRMLHCNRLGVVCFYPSFIFIWKHIRFPHTGSIYLTL